MEHLRIEQARLEDVTPPEGGFDAILAHSILHLLPMVRFFSADALVRTVQAVGFEVEARWQPTQKAAVFLIARKPLCNLFA